jgi:hypothetical protein
MSVHSAIGVAFILVKVVWFETSTALIKAMRELAGVRRESLAAGRSPFLFPLPGPGIP